MEQSEVQQIHHDKDLTEDVEGATSESFAAIPYTNRKFSPVNQNENLAPKEAPIIELEPGTKSLYECLLVFPHKEVSPKKETGFHVLVKKGNLVATTGKQQIPCIVPRKTLLLVWINQSRQLMCDDGLLYLLGEEKKQAEYAKVEKVIELKRLFRIELVFNKKNEKTVVSLMFFNKLYDKSKVPKVLEATIDQKHEAGLIEMIGAHIEPSEQKLIIVDKGVINE